MNPMPPRPKGTPPVHISEPHVSVTEWRFQPGAETRRRVHEADYVVVPPLDGELLLEEPGSLLTAAGLSMSAFGRHRPGAAERDGDSTWPQRSMNPLAQGRSRFG